MFDWLKRYHECGNPCQTCANECPVQAIHPTGEINPNECINCLHCQVLYQSKTNCPVVIKQVKAARDRCQRARARPGRGHRRTIPHRQTMLQPERKTDHDTMNTKARASAAARFWAQPPGGAALAGRRRRPRLP